MKYDLLIEDNLLFRVNVFRFFSYLGLWSIVSCLLSVSPAFAAGGDWLEGASGYAQGRAEAVASHKPMVVFFYTDWCGYCIKFSKNVLANPEVQKSLATFVKVRVNPEKGARENQLADQFGINGFPSVYFERPASGSGVQDLSRLTSSAKRFAAAADQFSKQSK